MVKILRQNKDGSPHIVPSEVYDAREEAERILAEARQEADRILQEASRQAREARVEARRLGEEEGRAEVSKRMLEVQRIRDQILEQAEGELVQVATAVAKRIIQHELSARPEQILGFVGQALTRVRRAKDVRISVHPDDVTIVQQALDAGGFGAGANTNVRVEADNAIERGGCILRSDVGMVDARIEVQLDALARALSEH